MLFPAAVTHPRRSSTGSKFSFWTMRTLCISSGTLSPRNLTNAIPILLRFETPLSSSEPEGVLCASEAGDVGHIGTNAGYVTEMAPCAPSGAVRRERPYREAGRRHPDRADLRRKVSKAASQLMRHLAYRLGTTKSISCLSAVLLPLPVTLTVTPIPLAEASER